VNGSEGKYDGAVEKVLTEAPIVQKLQRDDLELRFKTDV
jgi:hypothetical protein